MATLYYKTLGRFNLCGSEKNWQVVLRTDAGAISALWDEDDEPAIDDLLPSEVLDMLHERLNRPHFWSSSRDRNNATIEKLRESISTSDREWLTVRVELAQAALKNWEQRLQDLTESA